MAEIIFLTIFAAMLVVAYYAVITVINTVTYLFDKHKKGGE